MAEDRLILFSVRGTLTAISDGELGNTTISTFCPAHSQEEAEEIMRGKITERTEGFDLKVESLFLVAEQVEIPGYEIIVRAKK